MELQSNDIFIHTAVKVKMPDDFTKLYKRPEVNEFDFERDNIFKDYLLNKNDPYSFLSIDDNNNCYYITYFRVSSLSDLKISRQIFKPSYFNNNTEIPLISRLDDEGLETVSVGYDKAYSHVSVFTNNINDFSPLEISRLANVDGDDDPTVINKIHYISNIYKDLETRFVPGVETNSFLTITENKEYFNNIHIPNVSALYLKFFIYFLFYDCIPSKQMMPRLLGNLWRSVQVNRNDYNNNLFKTLSFENKSTS